MKMILLQLYLQLFMKVGHAIYEQDIPDSLEGTGLNVAQLQWQFMNLNQDFMKISLERVENLAIIYIMNQLSNLKGSLKEFQKNSSIRL